MILGATIIAVICALEGSYGWALIFTVLAWSIAAE